MRSGWRSQVLVALLILGLAVAAFALYGWPVADWISEAGDDPGAAPATHGPTASETSLPSPSPSPPTTTMPVRSQTELPRDAAGAWTPRALIPRTDLLVVCYDPFAASPEAQRLVSGRVGLMPLEGGPIREFHTTESGNQVGRVASDGRYLAWVEVGVFGARQMDWRLFLVDLAAPGAEPREIAAGPGIVPWLPIQGPPFALANGLLAYSRYLEDSATWRNELVVLDVDAGTSWTVAAGPIATEGHITGIALELWGLTWIRRQVGVDPPLPGTVVCQQRAIGAPVTCEEVPETIFEIGGGGGMLVATTATGVLFREPSGPWRPIPGPGGRPMGLFVAANHAYWVDTLSMRPVSTSLWSPAPVEFDTAYTLQVFSDDQTVAWWTRPDSVPGRPVEHFYVNWMPAPPN